MWCSKVFDDDMQDSTPTPTKKKRCTQKKGKPEKVAVATTSIGTASPTAGTTYRNKQHEDPSTTNASCKRKALNKDEKQPIKNSLIDLKPEVTTAISLVNVLRQLPASNLNVTVFCNAIMPSSIAFFTKHMHQIFLELYNRKNICTFR